MELKFERELAKAQGSSNDEVVEQMREQLDSKTMEFNELWKKLELGSETNKEKINEKDDQIASLEGEQGRL